MGKTVKYLFILVLAAIPILLIFSGLSEKPAKIQARVTEVKMQTFLHETNRVKTAIRLPRHVITTVEEYEKVSSFGSLPEIYSGLSIDGELKTDKNGNLIISEEVKLLFDFFLSAQQTEGPGLCSDRVREYIGLTLSGKAAEKALELFSLYQTYLEQTAEAENGLTVEMDFTSPEETISSLKETLQNRISLSRKIFGAETANQLFNTNHMAALYIINKIDILQSSTASDSEKEILIAEEKNHLPSMQKIREDRDQQEKSFELTISKLQKKGADQDIFDLRKEKYGESAARKLSQLDNRNQALQNRIEQFLSKKQRLLDIADPGSQKTQQQIDELRKNSFEEWELSALRKAEVIIDRQS